MIRGMSPEPASRTRLSARKKALVLTLALVAVGLVAHLWACRVEYFMIPAAWRETREAWRRFEAAEPLSDEASDRRVAVGEAVTALIRLQDPGFAGGAGFRLQEIPTSPGVVLVCYQNSDEGMLPPPNLRERLPHPESGELLPESMDYHHRFLRSNGRLFVPDSGFFVGHERKFSHSNESARDRSEGKTLPHWAFDPWPSKPGIYISYRRGSMSLPFDDGPFLYTWDERGFVPHGIVHHDSHTTPGTDSPDLIFERFDEQRMRALWLSGTPGDALRALSIYEAGEPSQREWILEATRHADADVRARALSLLGSQSEDLEAFRRALEDPIPRVRMVGLRGFESATCRGWVETLRRIERDPDPAVALSARIILTRSLQRDVAEAAVLRFEPGDLGQVSPSVLSRVSSPRLAERLVSWLEDGRVPSPVRGRFGEIRHPLEFVRRAHLAPFLPRMRTALRTGRHELLENGHLLAGIVALEDDGLDALLFDPEGPAFSQLLAMIRSDDDDVEAWALFRALWTRRRPKGAQAYEEALAGPTPRRAPVE